jgi:hypothetical protein
MITLWERTFKLRSGGPNTTIVVDLADVLVVRRTVSGPEFHTLLWMLREVGTMGCK